MKTTTTTKAPSAQVKSAGSKVAVAAVASSTLHRDEIPVIEDHHDGSGHAVSAGHEEEDAHLLEDTDAHVTEDFAHEHEYEHEHDHIEHEHEQHDEEEAHEHESAGSTLVDDDIVESEAHAAVGAAGSSSEDMDSVLKNLEDVRIDSEEHAGGESDLASHEIDYDHEHEHEHEEPLHDEPESFDADAHTEHETDVEHHHHDNDAHHEDEDESESEAPAVPPKYPAAEVGSDLDALVNMLEAKPARPISIASIPDDVAEIPDEF